MANKDKVIAAFLVSMGFFSAVQAMQYVAKLGSKEKNEIYSVSLTKGENIQLCETASFPQDIQTNKRG